MNEGIRKLTVGEIYAQRPALSEIGDLPRRPILGLLDNVRSLNNVGAIFRTADGLRMQQLVLCGMTGTPPRHEIRKTALGAEEAVPWSYDRSAAQAVDRLKADGVQILVLEHTTNSIDYREITPTFPCCLVVGHEVDGVSDEIIPKADQILDIPMDGVKASLNVSVAFGIVAYHLRGGKLQEPGMKGKGNKDK